MATEILPINTGAADADIVVAAGAPVLICLKAVDEIPTGARVNILVADDDGNYFKIGDLRSDIQSRSAVLYAPGTYNVEREADSAAVGVFSA